MVHGKKPIGIDEDLPGAYLFQVEMVPKWFEPLVSLLTIQTLHNQPPHVVGKSRLYALLEGQLYHAQANWVLSQCIEPKDQ